MDNLPPLRLQVLSALLEIKQRVTADPNYLDSPDVPYDGQTLETLKQILAPQIVKVEVERGVPKGKAERGRPSKDIVLSAEDQEEVRLKLKKLMEDLETMDTGEGLETSERVQIARLKANLIEQLMKLQERAFNVKRMSEFQEIVMSILEDLVTEKDREVFLARIEPYR